MSKYIDANKLIAEIESRLSEIPTPKAEDSDSVENFYRRDELMRIKKFVQTLQQEAENERIKKQKELNKIAINYRDAVIAHIEKKRVLPFFKGQLLHDFKNEVNTMRQILGVFDWGDVQNVLFEKFALVFAAWGGHHFHPKEIKSEDSLQQEQPEVSVECYVRVYPTLDNKPRPWVSLCKHGISCNSIRDIPELENLGFKDDDTAIVTIKKK